MVDKKTLRLAKKWSMDKRNKKGEAVVCQSPIEAQVGGYIIATECSTEHWVVARYIKGKRRK